LPANDIGSATTISGTDFAKSPVNRLHTQIRLSALECDASLWVTTCCEAIDIS